jgi:hypothetical protein
MADTYLCPLGGGGPRADGIGGYRRGARQQNDGDRAGENSDVRCFARHLEVFLRGYQSENRLR